MFTSTVAPATYIETIGAKMRRLANVSESASRFDTIPLSPPPAWASGVAVVQGNVRSNAGNWYVATGSATTGATAPTHTNGQSVSDGGVGWTYFGPAMTTTNDALLPTVTTTGTTPADLPLYFDAQNFAAYFKYHGGYGSPYSTNGMAFKSFYANATTLTAIGASIEFETTASKFAIVFPVGGEPPCRIAIDGRYISPDSITTVVASPNYVVVDSSAIVQARQWRRVRVDLANSGQPIFGGVRVTANDSVRAPSSQDDINCVTISDSLFAGSSYGPLVVGGTVALRLCASLGWRLLSDMSKGGTGYVNQNTSFYNFLQRVQDANNAATIAKADVVVLMGSTNDMGLSGITTNATQTFQAIRKLNAKAPIIVFGLWPLNNAAVATTEALVVAGLTAANDANVYWRPLFARSPLPLVTGAWNNGANTSSTNSGLYISGDNVHPPEIGTRYLADQLAWEIRSGVLPLIK